MKRLSVFLIALMALAFAGLGQANIIYLVDEAGEPQLSPPESEQADRTQYFVDATSCAEGSICIQGLLGTPVVLSDTLSTARTNAGDTEAQQLTYLTGLGVTLGDPTFAERTDGNPTSITTVREYFSVTQGDWVAFFKNVSGGTVTVTFDRPLSNYTEFGAEVPIPAAFILFGSGLVGLGWLARRQRARKDSVV